MITSRNSIVLRRHLPVIVTLLLGLLALIVLVAAPAYRARDALDELKQAEQAQRCEHEAVESPALTAVARKGQQQDEAGGERAGGDDRGERADDVQDGAECSGRRANLIAIEALRSSNAATFVSFVVGVASILAVAGAILAARESGRARLAEVALEIAFEQAVGDAGDIVLANFGAHPAWLLDVSVGRAVPFSSADDGLKRMDPGGTVRFTRSLADVDGRRSPIEARYQDGYGRQWTLTAELGRRHGRWSVDRMENRPKY